MTILVSACLLGHACRYDGTARPTPGLSELLAGHTVVPICPESLGGLAIPRPPAEQRDGRVVSRDGADVTESFRRGAQAACRIAREHGATLALLKARSPSCGSTQIYDGTFTGRLIPGEGIAARALREKGVEVFDETQLESLKERLDS